MIKKTITMSRSILITGATGHFGKATIEALLKKGIAPAEISALVRDESKAADLNAQGIQLKTGDYSNYDSLVATFTGVDKLLLVSGTDIEHRQEQQANAVNAAAAAGVKHIVYTSFVRKNETESSPIWAIGKSHIATDNLIKRSGIPYTLMLNTLYADVLPMFLGEKVLETGVFYPAGEGKAAYTTRQDMAEAAAAILTGSGHENKTYMITNTETYSLDDVAAALSKLTGREVMNNNPPASAYVDALTHAGVPAPYIGMFSGFAEAIRQGEFDTTGSDLENLIGRKPTSLHNYLASVYSTNN